MEPKGNVHEHVFFDGIPTHRVATLDEGIACVMYLFMSNLPNMLDVVFDGFDDGKGIFQSFLPRS